MLLVEDNEINRQIATEMLEMLGATVEIAVNGRQAVDAVCSHPALYYDIVFMDIQMPVMNGYEATKSIRQMERADAGQVLIFAMTADAFSDDIALAKKVGMNAHFAKPLDLTVMMKEIRKLVSENEVRQNEEV